MTKPRPIGLYIDTEAIMAKEYESYWREKIAGEIENKLDDIQVIKSDSRLSYFEGKEVGLAMAISVARGDK